MEIEIKEHTQLKLKALLSEKALIEQRINDILFAVCDINDVDINSNIQISQDLKKIIIL